MSKRIQAIAIMHCYVRYSKLVAFNGEWSICSACWFLINKFVSDHAQILCVERMFSFQFYRPIEYNWFMDPVQVIVSRLNEGDSSSFASFMQGIKGNRTKRKPLFSPVYTGTIDFYWRIFHSFIRASTIGYTILGKICKRLNILIWRHTVV